MIPKLSATSFFTFLAHFRHPEAHHEQPLLLLPAPKAVPTVTAATWERKRHPCPICDEEMTKEIFSERYFCLPCDELVAEEARKQLSKARMPVFRTGELVRSYHHAQAPGTYARNIRRAWQEETVKQVLSALETNKNIQNTPEISKQRPPTGPLPARDITLANTPRNPATPTPETRESLFADVPDIPHEEEEIDEEATEKRRIVRKATDTVEIPAMNAEVILEALMHGKTHEQNTGENERLPAKIGNWML